MSDLGYMFIFWSKMTKMALFLAHLYQPRCSSITNIIFKLSFLQLIVTVWDLLEAQHAKFNFMCISSPWYLIMV